MPEPHAVQQPRKAEQINSAKVKYKLSLCSQGKRRSTTRYLLPSVFASRLWIGPKSCGTLNRHLKVKADVVLRVCSWRHNRAKCCQRHGHTGWGRHWNMDANQKRQQLRHFNKQMSQGCRKSPTSCNLRHQSLCQMLGKYIDWGSG